MVLVGVQPVLTHVPPKRPRSMMATFMPEPASRRARDGPDCPVPMMIASKSVMALSLGPQELSDRGRAAAKSQTGWCWRHFGLGCSRPLGGPAMTIDIEPLRKTLGTKIEDEDTVTQAPLKAMIATFDRPDKVPAPGEPIAPGWHLCFLHSYARPQQLGRDGAAFAGGVLPAIPKIGRAS